MASTGLPSDPLSCSAPLTFHQHLGDLGVAGAEGTVDLEAVSVVQEGAPQGEEDFLRREEVDQGGHTMLLPGVHSVL